MRLPKWVHGWHIVAFIFAVFILVNVVYFLTTGHIPTRCDYTLEPDWFSGCK